MDYVIAFVVIVICLGVIFMLVLERYHKVKKMDYLNMPKKSPVTDDCIWQARKMVSFINDRLKDVNEDPFAACKTGMNEGCFKLMDSHDVVDLVRYAHLAGCKICIEQVADHDIENPRNTEAVLKKYHTDLRRSRSERLEKKFSQR